MLPLLLLNAYICLYMYICVHRQVCVCVCPYNYIMYIYMYINICHSLKGSALHWTNYLFLAQSWRKCSFQLFFIYTFAFFPPPKFWNEINSRLIFHLLVFVWVWQLIHLFFFIFCFWMHYNVHIWGVASSSLLMPSCFLVLFGSKFLILLFVLFCLFFSLFSCSVFSVS